MGVMKMGNVPRAGIEAMSLAFRASVFPLHHIRSLMSPLYPCLLVYAAPCLGRSVQTTTGILSLLMLLITDTQAMALHIHRFNKHTVCSLSRQPDFMGMMKMGNIVPRAGLELRYLAFQASVLTIIPRRLPDATTIPMSTCLCSSLPQRSVQTTTISWLVVGGLPAGKI